ncbi:hypothetical protein EC957_008807 [Mortierella hygrophila]|uniref:F-box domain-containing protein n=1 Tax=Mortierella hygrophila TaxID=979708 RepID=A0A9P6K5C7_9FUNG|nr:hypothetical protein EC957_008807 [Mortierella hygrophila]
MATSATTKNPFDLPEFKHRISRYVTIKDACSCALVSKAWTDDFVSAIWFKIDFDFQSRFTDLSPHIIAKYGHYIQIVMNAKSFSKVSSLANASVNRLRTLHIDTAASALQHILAYEILSRNYSSLHELHLLAHSFPADKRSSSAHYVVTPALVIFPGTISIPSKLNHLRIENLCLTNDGLVMILQGCPGLSALWVEQVEIVGPSTRLFQHMGINLLSLDLINIYTGLSRPSILSYFPNLTTLHTWSRDTSYTIPWNGIKEELSRHCPRLIGYQLEDSTGAIVHDFLANIANNNNVSRIMFEYCHISSNTITAILMHQTFLKSVEQFTPSSDFDLEREVVAPVSSHFQASGHLLQLIPRCCPRLVSLCLMSHEMDMDVVERGEWACRNLVVLKIRVKGLDTKEKILKAVALWRAGCWRRRQGRTNEDDAVMLKVQDQRNCSIETRVAKHLLKFDKLNLVWLGDKIPQTIHFIDHVHKQHDSISITNLATPEQSKLVHVHRIDFKGIQTPGDSRICWAWL